MDTVSSASISIKGLHAARMTYLMFREPPSDLALKLKLCCFGDKSTIVAISSKRRGLEEWVTHWNIVSCSDYGTPDRTEWS